MRTTKSCHNFFRYSKTGKYDTPKFHPLMEDYIAHLKELEMGKGVVGSISLCRNALIVYMTKNGKNLIKFSSWTMFGHFFWQIWQKHPEWFFKQPDERIRTMITADMTNVECMGELGAPEVFMKETTPDDPMEYEQEPELIM